MNIPTCPGCGQPTILLEGCPVCQAKTWQESERLGGACIAMSRVMTFVYMSLSAKEYSATIKDSNYSLLRIAKDAIEHGLLRLEFP